MATPNYSFAKRQRDLEKKRKKEEKLKAKTAAKLSQKTDDLDAPEGEESEVQVPSED